MARGWSLGGVCLVGSSPEGPVKTATLTPKIARHAKVYHWYFSLTVAQSFQLSSTTVFVWTLRDPVLSNRGHR